MEEKTKNTIFEFDENIVITKKTEKSEKIKSIEKKSEENKVNTPLKEEKKIFKDCIDEDQFFFI